jgi:hypothetical protein
LNNGSRATRSPKYNRFSSFALHFSQYFIRFFLKSRGKSFANQNLENPARTHCQLIIEANVGRANTNCKIGFGTSDIGFNELLIKTWHVFYFLTDWYILISYLVNFMKIGIDSKYFDLKLISSVAVLSSVVVLSHTVVYIDMLWSYSECVTCCI